MSAAVLREAAAKMRERAEAATPGPWTPSKFYGVNVVSSLGQIVGRGNRQAGELTDAVGESFNAANTKHIASWHPAVALAVADWLDVMAVDLTDNTILDRPESDEGHLPNPEALWCDKCGGAVESPDYVGPENECQCWTAALAVARAYLGDPK